MVRIVRRSNLVYGKRLLKTGHLSVYGFLTVAVQFCVYVFLKFLIVLYAL